MTETQPNRQDGDGLLPCPFCGAMPLIIEELDNLVHCARGCGSRSANKEIWNRRAPTRDAAEGAGRNEIQSSDGGLRAMLADERNDWRADLHKRAADRDMERRTIELKAETSESATPKPAPDAMRERGWLIEKDDPPVYCVINPNDYDEHWTSDTNSALRFARNKDAQAYVDHIGWTSPPVRVTEHIWDDGKGETGDDICAACGAARREHATPGGTRYGEHSLCGIFIPQASSATGAAEPVLATRDLQVLAEWIEHSHSVEEYITVQIHIEQRAAVVSALRATPPVRGDREAIADDIRAHGWTVAVHNDYRQGGEAHTFWLFTNGRENAKGEGKTDAEALNQVRAILSIPVQPGAGEQ